MGAREHLRHPAVRREHDGLACILVLAEPVSEPIQIKDGRVEVQCMECGGIQQFYAATVAEAEEKATAFILAHNKVCPKRN